MYRIDYMNKCPDCGSTTSRTSGPEHLGGTEDCPACGTEMDVVDGNAGGV